MTQKEARNTEIFIINDEGSVEKTTLYEHVMESQEETTSPRGVEPKVHVRYDGRASFDKFECDESLWEVWTWGVRGNNPKKLHEGFESFDDADEKVFQNVFENEFIKDDQRDTWFTEDKDEAKQIVIDRGGEPDSNYRFFKHKYEGYIIIVPEKEITEIAPLFGLEYYDEEDEEWQSVDEEAFFDFDNEQCFNLNMLGQVNGSCWQSLEHDVKYRMDFNKDEVMDKSEVIEVLRQSCFAHEVAIAWDGSNHVVTTLNYSDNPDVCDYEEVEISINPDECDESSDHNTYTRYVYTDDEGQRWEGISSRFATDLFETISKI